MSQTMMLNLPDPLYRHLEFLARMGQRTVEEETVEVLAATLPESVALPADLAEAIASLSLLDDSALAQAAKVQLPEAVSAEMERLHIDQQRQGISESEARRLAELIRQYERTMLVRAQAAAILKQRSRDLGESLKP